MKMTDKRLAKRLAKLCDSFNDMCVNRDCKGCEMEAFADEGVCQVAWILKKMTKVKKPERKCESCKHYRWFGEYAMMVCEKHGTVSTLVVCKDYEEKGGEE